MKTARLEFDVADLRRLVRHARAATAHQKFWGREDTGACLCLVKDEGIYLMSSGLPRDIVTGTTSFVAYAKGFDPREAGYEWQMGQDAVGGDDFGEPIPLEAFESALALPHLIGLRVDVSPRAINVVVLEHNPASRHATKGR